MKTKDFLWGMLASMFLVGCSQNEDLPEGGNEKGENEWSYMAINVNEVPDAGSRSVTEGGYVYGTKDENKVKDAYFFFFKSNGDPFTVTDYVPGGDGEAGRGGENWVKYTFSDSGQDGSGSQNVERKLAAVLALKKMTEYHPDQVVAVLGWAPSSTSAINLVTLRKTLGEQYKNNEGYFIMSNSVYNNGTKNMYATALTDANFATTKEAALAHPVDIYVERLAVRMGVSLNSDKLTDGKFKVDVEPITIVDEANPVEVYAEILGWDINTTVDHTYLQKDIEGNGSWDLGFGWNKSSDYRSHWAVTPYGTIGEHTINFDKSFDFNEFNTLDKKDYCLENTNQSNKTKVIVRAQLKDKEGNALSIASWMGQYYRLVDLKGAVVSSLATSGSPLYYKVGEGEWTSINAEVGGEVPGCDFIDLIRGDNDGTDEGADYYKAIFTLSDAGKTVKWSYDKTTELEEQAVITKLQSLSFAKIWTDGNTYYFLDVEHLGGHEKHNYGVVRNHAYEIVIDGVAGLGTPVFITETGDDYPEIPDPVIPDESETFLSAKINILSWKLVTNNVTLGK